MLEILVRLLPLIFFSCAVGIVILNIRAIFSYIIYILTTAFQPKQLLITTEQIQQNQQIPRSFNVFSPLIHMWTLFRVLFLPDLDISEMMNRNKESKGSWTSNVYQEKTQEEASKTRIKTYSVVDSRDTSHFRSALEPAEQQNVSSVFATAFPSLTKKVTSTEGGKDSIVSGT